MRDPKKKLPQSYIDRMNKLEETGGIVERNFTKDPNQTWQRLGESSSDVDKPIKKKIQENVAMETLKDKALKSGALNKKVPKSAIDAYAKNAPKKLHVKGSGRFGLLAGVLGLGAGLLPEDSKAAEIAQRIGAAASEMDPGTHLDRMLNKSDIDMQKLLEERDEKKRIQAELNKPAVSDKAISNAKGLLRGDQDILQNTAKPMIKQLGGPADVNPRLAAELLGEQESPDYESGLDPVKEIARRKKQLGY